MLPQAKQPKGDRQRFAFRPRRRPSSCEPRRFRPRRFARRLKPRAISTKPACAGSRRAKKWRIPTAKWPIARPR